MTAYYNEIDPYAAAWLRNLIAAGHIAPGDVDQRSILDVRPDELKGYNQYHFFAGIGVWSYALRLAGWPDDRPVWTGSCPCQPFSAAGKGNGFADERHLWPYWHHLIRECRPDTVFGEQVASKDGLAWLDLVHADMEGEGYAVGALDTCAAGVGAPHIRQRLYFAAKRLEHAELSAQSRQRFVGGSAVCEQEAAGLAGNSVAHKLGKNSSDSGLLLGDGIVTPSGLADSSGERRDRCEDTARTGRRHGAQDGGESGRMADSDSGQCNGLAVIRGVECDGPDAGREESCRISGARGDDGRLADSNGGESRKERRIQSERNNGQQPSDNMVSPRIHIPRARGQRNSERHAGPTNGIWRDADWLFCRDGKWRPVSPSPQPMVDGIAHSLGRVRSSDVQEIEEEINAWEMERKISRSEALRDLWRAAYQETPRIWSAGRIPGLHEATFLLSFLRQLAQQGWGITECLSIPSAQIPQGRMRVLWSDIGTACAPYQHELEGQSKGEYTDALRVLSSILACHAHKAWSNAHAAYAETCFPLTSGAAGRVGRLRAYGNAIVAPLAAEVIRAFMECRS